MTKMEQKIVKLIIASELAERQISFTTSNPWELHLLNNDDEIEYSCTGLDLFECLTILRKSYLEKKGYHILCNGSRIDVYPSRMSRQMSGGRKAYIMRMGEQAKRSDLVDIFDEPDDISCIGSVDEQEEYKNKWMDSLG